MKAIKSIFILSLISISVYAGNEIQTGKSNDVKSFVDNTYINSSLTISGDIIDQENNETLAGAAIYIDGKKIYSDLNGHFKLPVSQPGKYNMKVELISYETTEMQVEVTQNSKLEIVLAQK